MHRVFYIQGLCYGLSYCGEVFEEMGEKLKSIGWSFSYTKAEAKQVVNQQLAFDIDTIR